MIEWCRSYDINPSVCSVANVINNTWEMKEWSFKSLPMDANLVDFSDGTNTVINTSTEHFSSNQWYENIPEGFLCLFQGNDLDIEDHVQRPQDLAHFKSMFPLKTMLFEGELKFPEYTRYMIIGHK